MNAWGEYNRLLVRTTWKKSFPFAKFYRDSLSGKSTAAWLIMRRWYWSRKLREVCQKGADFTDHLQPQNLVYFRWWLLVLYDYITRQENRIMNNHELFWKLTGDWGQEKTFWLVPHSARCDWLMRPRPSINQIQTLKCDPYNFSEHALSSVWKRRGTSIVRFSFQVILFNSVKLLLFAIQSVRK